MRICQNGNFYKMTSSGDFSVSVMARGASVVEIIMPDRNIALCPPTLEERDACYAGATLAPNAGRISGAQFALPDGKICHLSRNDGKHNLHGGNDNASRAIWRTGKIFCNDTRAEVEFSLAMPDGLDGFPGNRNFLVRYILEEPSTLTIEYKATSDTLTWVNLSNHTYFNLSGDFSRKIHSHSLQINSQNVWLNDAEHIPQKNVPVEGTQFDFRSPKAIPKIDQGFNNAFDVRGAETAAILFHRESGRSVRVSTDYPALVFYSGFFLAQSECALALEAQEFPNAVNIKNVPRPFLNAGEIFERFIKLDFSSFIRTNRG